MLFKLKTYTMKWKYLLVFLAVFIVMSCEEDVVLDLKKIEKKLVVEASITNENPAVRVALSYSEGFYDSMNFQKVTNAKVEIVDSNGEKKELNLFQDDLFITVDFQPVAGVPYTLNISADGYDFSVVTQLPHPVEISRVLMVPNPFFGDGDSLNVFVNVEDPKGEDNYFRLFVNQKGWESIGEFYLVDDALGKDGMITMPVYYKNFAVGDTVVVELRHLTKELYSYYLGLSDNIGGSFNSIAPGNPVSNLPDDVYGVFGGYSIDRDTIIVKQMEF